MYAGLELVLECVCICVILCMCVFGWECVLCMFVFMYVCVLCLCLRVHVCVLMCFYVSVYMYLHVRVCDFVFCVLVKLFVCGGRA